MDKKLKSILAPLEALKEKGLGRPGNISLELYFEHLIAAQLLESQDAEKFLFAYHSLKYQSLDVSEEVLDEIDDITKKMLAKVDKSPEKQLQTLKNKLRPIIAKSADSPEDRSDNSIGDDAKDSSDSKIPSSIDESKLSSSRVPALEFLKRSPSKITIIIVIIFWSILLIGIGIGVGIWQHKPFLNCLKQSRHYLKHGQFAPEKKKSHYTVLKNALKQNPHDFASWNEFGNYCFDRHIYGDALNAYSQAWLLKPEDAEIINNLAWLMSTAEDPLYRNPKKALELAKKAYKLKPSPNITDTLAEAFYVNGDPLRAIQLEKMALKKNPEDRSFYEKQLRKFEEAAK